MVKATATERSLGGVVGTFPTRMGYLSVFEVLGTKTRALSLNFGRDEVKGDKPKYFNIVGPGSAGVPACPHPAEPSRVQVTSGQGHAVWFRWTEAGGDACGPGNVGPPIRSKQTIDAAKSHRLVFLRRLAQLSN